MQSYLDILVEIKDLQDLCKISQLFLVRFFARSLRDVNEILKNL